jgi:3-oxoadipate enol-lactonase
MSYATCNGISIYFETLGSGPPIVVVGGLGVEVSDIAAITYPLAERLQVLTFDNRGTGRSDRPDAPYRVGLMAADAAALMDQIGWRSACVMGICFGGRIALELSLQRPDLVDRVILVSSAARASTTRWRQVATSTVLRRMFPGEHPQPRYVLERQTAASAADELTARLGALSVPVLILHGNRDKIVPISLAGEWRRCLPDSTLMPLPGGHLFFILRSRRRFLDAVVAFASDGR